MLSSRIAKFPVVFSRRAPVLLSVAFPPLTFLLEMAQGGLHTASPTSIDSMDAAVVVPSKGSLPATAWPCRGHRILLFVSGEPLQPGCHSSLLCPQGCCDPHTWKSRNVLKTKVHSGEMLAMNWQNSCQAWCPGKLCLGRGELCFVILFLMVSSWPFVTQVPL